MTAHLWRWSSSRRRRAGHGARRTASGGRPLSGPSAHHQPSASLGRVLLLLRRIRMLLGRILRLRLLLLLLLHLRLRRFHARRVVVVRPRALPPAPVVAPGGAPLLARARSARREGGRELEREPRAVLPTNLPAAVEVARGHGRRLVGEVHVPHLVPGPVRLQSRRHASALREELREVRVRDPRKIRDEQRRDARAGDRRRHRTKTRRPSPHTRSRDRRSDRAKPRASRAPSISQRQVNFHEAARQVTNWTAIFLVFSQLRAPSSTAFPAPTSPPLATSRPFLSTLSIPLPPPTPLVSPHVEYTT